ncbi:WD40 repeat domain-containing serine/threonine protein kinase [Roseimicrobium sp. ORNL1]|uniref:WD40 repeat domain-containing serine/threonine protein kinase n=1 Tax=Roseimicrobium sp. ORNL1 TaxID=2711231 RepID=UPI0013E19C64|nr:WD40 repeat domain-containing serine/threonine protein kinase [Roseimicrobium sp. ORNL1]QIF00700.1 protein kinase [Roseimicrobium sp. ORNL1]
MATPSPAHVTAACPVCGNPVPEQAPEFLCPACLLKLATCHSTGNDGGTMEGVDTPAEESAHKTTTSFKVGFHVGAYEILREIGRGGMGKVYEARHAKLNRKVALKVLPWADFASPEQLERFRREAEAAARLQHPNIIAVHEWGYHENCPYMAMQLVENARSLADEIARGALPMRRAAQLVATVARAVHFSHQHGILHRDIKPSNILLNEAGNPLLVDFGLARLDDAAFSLTRSDLVFGTPAYMSPEQATGEDLTTACDVYSLGAVLYEALSGRPLFRGKTVAETLRQVVEREPQPLRVQCSTMDRELEIICLKCVEKKVERRYDSALALAEDLEHWLKDMPIRARASTITSRAMKWARRRPGVAVLSVALVLTALIGLAGVFINWTEAVQARKEQTSILWDSLLSEARARRWSHQPGARYLAIESLQRAAAIRPSMELQNEAVAVLVISDLRPAEVWEGNPDRQPIVALSTDFTLTAHALKDGTVVVTERASSKQVSVLPGEGKAASRLIRFSPDAHWLAVGYESSADRIMDVKVWDWKNATLIHQWHGVHDGALSFWSDASRICVCLDRELRIYELAHGSLQGAPVALPAEARMVAVSPRGDFLAINFVSNEAMPEGRVMLLDLRQAEVKTSWLDHPATVGRFAWHPRMNWLAVPSPRERTIRIWDAETGTLRQMISGPLDNVYEAVWNPGGELIATGSRDGSLKLWDATTGEMYVSQESTTEHLQFSTDGSRLGVGQDGTRVRLYEVTSLGACRRLRSPSDGTVYRAAWNHDGSIIGATSEKVRFWNAEGYELASLNFQAPRGLFFCKDSLIVTGGSGVWRWPMQTQTSGKKLQVVLDEPEALTRDPSHGYSALAGDEQRLAVVFDDGVRVFNLSSRGSAPLTLTGHARAHTVSMSPDGRLVATGTYAMGNDVWVWNAQTGEVVQKLAIPGGAAVAFAVNGKWLITGSSEEFRCWDTSTWKPGAVHPKHDQIGDHIAMSPRGTVAAIPYARNKVKMVNAETLEDVGEPDCGPHVPLCFGPDGSQFLSANPQGFLFQWDMAWIRQEVARLRLDWKFTPLVHQPSPLVEEMIVPKKGVP